MSDEKVKIAGHMVAVDKHSKHRRCDMGMHDTPVDVLLFKSLKAGNTMCEDCKDFVQYHMDGSQPHRDA